MKRGAWLWMSAAVMLPSLAMAQAKPGATAAPPGQSAAPAKNAQIVKYEVTKDRDRPLRISYSDGTVVQIPKERGRFGVDDVRFLQETFSHIQVANDRQHIGWVAEYNDIRLCAQSYACSMEVVIFRAGQKPRYVSGDSGNVWDWSFLADGKQVVLHSGFSHGDENGYYLLFDSDGGPARASFTPGKGRTPAWIKPLQSTETQR